MSKILQIVLSLLLLCAFMGCSTVKPSEKMTGEKLSDLILAFDEDAKVNETSVEFTLAERAVFLVYDTKADRMRIMSPIAPAALANADIHERMLQANYDAVLDARYALANNAIWAVFIHPMGSLTKDDFLSGVAQTVTAAETFGSTYTSGAMVFGGGDSSGIHQDLLKDLEDATDSRQKI